MKPKKSRKIGKIKDRTSKITKCMRIGREIKGKDGSYLQEELCMYRYMCMYRYVIWMYVFTTLLL